VSDSVRAVAGRLTGASDYGGVAFSDFVACARENRVHLMIAGNLCADAPRDAALWSALRVEYREAAAQDAAETSELRRLIDVASNHGVRPLLFKGAALAHRLYERSWERPRLDIDLFIAEGDAPAMRRALETAGYSRLPAVDGRLVTRQFQYARATPAGLQHQVDVHTALFNPPAFAHALEWRDADARAVAIPALGSHARTLSDADALLVACLHRVAHHYDAPDLIWLCDIDRLARRLCADEWASFVSSAARARVRAVCESSLAAAARLFETPVPATVTASLAEAAGEPSASFLERGSGELHVQWLNLQHLAGWRARVMLVLEHVFPSRDYMRARYGAAGRWMLPACYVHRVCAGVPRWLRSHES
jgi:hypothetical protein